VQFVLWDRSKTGTLVNGRRVLPSMTLQPGDWIRLGPAGPVLRFLGQAAEQKRTSSA
jgi:pSer/pThr/pTyr-binding forkhead associated (FHA) protein